MPDDNIYDTRPQGNITAILKPARQVVCYRECVQIASRSCQSRSVAASNRRRYSIMRLTPAAIRPWNTRRVPMLRLTIGLQVTFHGQACTGYIRRMSALNRSPA